MKSKCANAWAKAAALVIIPLIPAAVPGYGIIRAGISSKGNYTDVCESARFARITIDNAYCLLANAKDPFEFYNDNPCWGKDIDLGDAIISHTAYPDKEVIDYTMKNAPSGKMITGMHSFVRNYGEEDFSKDPDAGGFWESKEQEKQRLEDCIERSEQYFGIELKI